MKKLFSFLTIFLVSGWSVPSAHAGIYERITSGESDKISTHAFNAALCELARGAVTRAQVISAFALDAESETEIDAIAAAYTAQPNATARAAFLLKINDVFILVEHFPSLYTKSKAKTELGF